MFGFSGKVDEDDDTNDSCSSTHKYFNAAVKPRSKLGRRRVVPQKDEKAQETDACHNGEQLLQSQWLRRDDSGIVTSESTPSLTHPVSKTGTLFNNQSKAAQNSLKSGFTPYFTSGRENRFALPLTPMRSFKSEPLKEINGVNNFINNCNSESTTLKSEANKEGSANILQKQLNKSFICDESLPLVASNDSHQNSMVASKACNETNSDDSSFMTAHDIHRPEVHSNKTFYDPEFFKTPGKNLAEIRIDESPFNPLEGFLEESDDFGDKSRTPLHISNCKVDPGQVFVAKTEVSSTKPCVKSLNVGPQASDHSQNDQMAYPLAETDVTPISKTHIRSETKNVDPLTFLDYHHKNNISQFKDNGFKHPGFVLGPPQKFGNKVELNLNSSDVGNMRSLEERDVEEIVHGVYSNDETTNVTYPQHSRSHHSQKNSFTSQFSLNPSPRITIQDNGKALSLSSGFGRPLSAASCATNRGVILSSLNASTNPFDKPPANARVGTLMNHPANHDDNRVSGVVEGRDSNGVVWNDRNSDKHLAHSITSETEVCPNENASGREPTNQLDSSTTWIYCVKPVKSQSNRKVPEPVVLADRSCGSKNQQEDSRKSTSASLVDSDTVVLDDPTVVAKGPSLPPKHQSEPPAPICPQQNPTSVPSQQHNRVEKPLGTPRDGNSVMSALAKPQPQNVITIKGTPYTILSLLGKGGSSQVYQALGPQSSKLMAIKCVNLATVEEAMATDYLNEIALLSKLQGCPCVIKMIEHEYDEQSLMLYVVLEKGDIDFSKLIKNISETKQISMPMITYYWTEMLSAVHEIHKRGIIHSDLKPANFLLVEGRLKLIDFGIASSLQGDDTTSVMKDMPAGTYNYMSPEAISGHKINRKSDVWSMGCILFNLLYGRTPFSHLNNRWQKLHAIADRNQKVVFPKLPHHTPPSLRLALRWCLIKDPASRPTVEELVKLSELAPHMDSNLGKEIDGLMCKYYRQVLPNLKVLSEEDDIV